MELGWGSGVKRILFGVFSSYFDEQQDLLQCKRYGDVEPLYKFSTKRYPYFPETPLTIKSVCLMMEDAEEIHFLLDDVEFKTIRTYHPVTGSIEYTIPMTLMELHIILAEDKFAKKTKFYKNGLEYDFSEVYNLWTNVQ